MSIARKILHNTLVQMIGKLVTAGLSVVVLKIISNYLGAAGYGDYTTVYQFLALFGIIADFGIYTISVKEMAKDETQIPMILGNVMGLRTFLALFAMALAALVAFMVPDYQNTLIPLGVLIATVATFFTLLNGTVSSVLQVHLKMQYATVGLILGKIVTVGYMIWVAFFLYPKDPILGFYHLLWGGVIGNLFMFIVTAYYTRRYAPITYRFDCRFWRKIFKTSLPYGVALMLNTLYFRMDIILLTFLLPHSSAVAVGSCKTALCGDTEVGLYGVAQRLLEMLLLIPLYFMNSVLPVMTRALEEKSEKVRHLIQYSFEFLAAAGVPILVGGVLLAAPIILLISAPEYLGGHVYAHGSDLAIQILMFGMLFAFGNSLFGFTLVVLNQQWRLMFVNAAGVLLNLIGNILVIPAFGFRGSAAVSVLSELLVLFLLYRVAKNVLHFHLSWKNFGKTLFSALMMGVCVYLGLQWMREVWFFWQLLLLVPLGMVVYAIMMLKTKAVTRDMLALLKKTS